MRKAAEIVPVIERCPAHREALVATASKGRMRWIDPTSRIAQLGIACPRIDAPDRPLEIGLQAHQFCSERLAAPRYFRQSSRPDARAVLRRRPVHAMHIDASAIPQPG